MNIKTSLALIASAAVLSGCGSVNSMLNETTQTHEFFRIYDVKGSSSKPPSLNDGGADLFKRVTFDQVLKSVESSRER